MRPAFLLAPVALALGAPAAAQTAPTIEAAAPRIDLLFERFQRETPTPGLVYGIVANGRLVHIRGFGVQDPATRAPMTADSLTRIASMTKAFTALSILTLRDAGKLDLDDLAEQHVPEMRGWTYPADHRRIRIRDLLSHTAGFVTDDPWGDRQTPLPEAEFTAMLKAGVPFSRPPGTAFEYSNFGYALLGRVVQNASGMPYRTYVERTILAPLGMTSSGFEVSESPRARRAIGYRWQDDAWMVEPTMAHGAFGAMGGLQVSANDYAKWVAFLLSAWPPRDAPEGPIKRATVRELAEGLNFQRAGGRSGTMAPGECVQAIAYGKGFLTAADCDLGLMMFHGGGYPGYGSHVLLLPEYGVGIFAFTNRTYTGASDVVWDAASVLAQSGAIARGAPPASPELLALYGAARAAFEAGDLKPLEGKLAMNFLMDRDAADRRTEFARLKAVAGGCPPAGKVVADGTMTLRFRWECDKAPIEGRLLLAPTRPLTIQALDLRVISSAPRP